jgi:hypothetical protein
MTEHRINYSRATTWVTVWCHRHLCLVSENTGHSPGRVLYLQLSGPVAPSPALAAVPLPSVPVDEPLLDVSSKWTCTVASSFYIYLFILLGGGTQGLTHVR